MLAFEFNHFALGNGERKFDCFSRVEQVIDGKGNHGAVHDVGRNGYFVAGYRNAEGFRFGGKTYCVVDAQALDFNRGTRTCIFVNRSDRHGCFGKFEILRIRNTVDYAPEVAFPFGEVDIRHVQRSETCICTVSIAAAGRGNLTDSKRRIESDTVHAVEYTAAEVIRA